ncbi:MAG TPA: MFS transporter [Dehalococcoidia bacterium]|nr:MFS transporter [Dehalococcoidia bacterium]
MAGEAGITTRASDGRRAPAPGLKHLATTFSSLRIYNYRLYWFGQLVSLTGTWMQRTAQAWLVLKLTDSALAVGTVTALQFLPITFLSLFGGVIADRVPKRRLLIVTQSISAVQALVLALLTQIGAIQLWHLYLLVLVLGLANAFDNPARQSFPVELVGRDEVANAVALNSTLFNTSRITGPALAGVALATVGVAGCFWLNAASFLATIGGLVLMRPERFFSISRPRRDPPLRLLREGVGYALRTPAIFVLVITLAFFGTFAFNFTVVVPLLARFTLRSGSLGYGLLFSAQGAGALVAALGLAYTRGQSLRTVFAGGLALSLALLCLGLSTIYGVSAALLALIGGAGIIYSASAQTRLQIIVPDQLRGRVMSIYTLLFAGTTPIGSVFIGAVSEHWNVQASLIASGALALVGLALAWLYLRGRSPAEMLRGTVLEATE